jgi:hypothetical protein
VFFVLLQGFQLIVFEDKPPPSKKKQKSESSGTLTRTNRKKNSRGNHDGSPGSLSLPLSETISENNNNSSKFVVEKKPLQPGSVLQNRGRISVGASPEIDDLSPTSFEKTVYLSIGRIFHELTLSGTTISVTRYFPRFVSSGIVET